MKKYLLALLFIAGTTVLLADPVTVTVKLTGSGNPTDIAYNLPGYPGGVYVGPYQLSINGGASVDALCVDPLHESNVGNSWTANVSAVGGDISKTYNATNTATVLGYSLSSTYGYEIDAILFDLIDGPSKSSLSDRITLQEAAWSVFDPTLFGSDTNTIQTNAFKIAENDGFSASSLGTFDFSNYQILTDVNGSKQEFLVGSAVPEPLSLGLMGFGLLGIAGVGLMRRRRKAASALA
ncbi:MAG TPA: PEP-CTERM sorting domain-containing protein [Bryobacteraceae bacterium]